MDCLTQGITDGHPAAKVLIGIRGWRAGEEGQALQRELGVRGAMRDARVPGPGRMVFPETQGRLG